MECFNPCYAGSKIESLIGKVYALFYMESFNPCYAGSKIERCGHRNIATTQRYMFQSLLCWK